MFSSLMTVVRNESQAIGIVAGAASRSFTSTSQRVVTVNERITEREERCPKKKAYLRLSTSLGDLNLELHSDMVCRTAASVLSDACHKSTAEPIPH
jgi:hypothetical protein